MLCSSSRAAAEGDSAAAMEAAKKHKPASSGGKGLFSCFSCAKETEEEVSELDFAHCSLEDVPVDIFAYERTLEVLRLQCNNVRDLPRQLFQCQELRELDLGDNDIRSLPEAVSGLSHLVRLDVSKNVLTEIPDTVKQLKQLRVLDVSINPLQKVPEGCTQLLNVTELYLNDTFLEFLPANFGRLVKLHILELRENGLSTLPKSLSRLTHLRRLDIGQNDFSDLPEVVGALTGLEELWLDGNRVGEIPSSLGNLPNLNHLEASFNQIEDVSEALGNCHSLVHLSLTTNDLQTLPDSLGRLSRLVTLKLDDNQLESLPSSLGGLVSLEELVVSQNYLTSLPPSVGLCRRLHTLNFDDNDLELLPSELGSCGSLRILSARDNRLTTLPAELDHISDLSVINLTGNLIRFLPVSFIKLRKISALWLSENQNKPLIQLCQDTDPETGNKVLTNFLLPQQDHNRCRPQEQRPTESSESESFQAWEEERSRNRLVRWAGEDEDSRGGQGRDKLEGKLRREPTPFPKEMRAMAKRVQSMRTSKVDSHQPDATAGEVLSSQHQRRRDRYLTSDKARRISSDVADRQGGFPDDMGLQGVLIKEAKVSKPLNSPVLSERHILSRYEDERTVKEQMELKQFEELEKSLNIMPNSPPLQEGASSNHVSAKNSNGNIALRRSPDKTSRDSGVITPSENTQIFPEDGIATSDRTLLPSSYPKPHHQTRNPSDPLPQAPENHNQNVVKPSCPPPYHIAAAMSKHAMEFSGAPGNVASDTNSVSGQSEVSTTASSLQTIVRSPLQHLHPSGISESRITSLRGTVVAAPPPPPPPDEGEGEDGAGGGDSTHAMQLRKVSEQLLANPHTRQSVTGVPVAAALRQSSSSSPANNLNSSLNTSSSSRPSSQMSFIPMGATGSSVLHNRAMSPRPPQASTPQKAADSQTAPVPSPASNGLLSTIEQAAHSDEEQQQPNYENVSTPAITSSSSKVSRIPKLSDVSSPEGERLSTSLLVRQQTQKQQQQQQPSRIPVMSPDSPVGRGSLRGKARQTESVTATTESSNDSTQPIE